MPLHLLPRLPTTLQILAALRDALGETMPVGLSTIPRAGNANTGPTATPPFAILNPLWAVVEGPEWDVDRHADAQWVYQLDLQGARGDQVEGMRDRAASVFLGKAVGGEHLYDLAGPGVQITARDLDDDQGLAPPTTAGITSTMRFRLWCTPADDAAPEVEYAPTAAYDFGAELEGIIANG